MEDIYTLSYILLHWHIKSSFYRQQPIPIQKRKRKENIDKKMVALGSYPYNIRRMGHTKEYIVCPPHMPCSLCCTHIMQALAT